MMDRLHREAKCCGINGWDDFINTPWGIDPKNRHLFVPDSCCIDDNEYSLRQCQLHENQEYYHRSGCHEKIKEGINQSGCDLKVK